MPSRMVYGYPMTHRNSQRNASFRPGQMVPGVLAQIAFVRGFLLLLVLVLISTGGAG
jgi:hypothetical protein